MHPTSFGETLPDHLFKFILRDNRDAERARFVELAPGGLARKDIGRFFRNRGRRLAAEGLNDGARLVARIFGECTGEDERFAEESVIAALLAAEHIDARLPK